jgi:hypothetical protein
MLVLEVEGLFETAGKTPGNLSCDLPVTLKCGKKDRWCEGQY